MMSIISNKGIVGCQTVCINQIQSMLENLSSAESFLIVTARDSILRQRNPPYRGEAGAYLSSVR